MRVWMDGWIDRWKDMPAKVKVISVMGGTLWSWDTLVLGHFGPGWDTSVLGGTLRSWDISVLGHFDTGTLRYWDTMERTHRGVMGHIRAYP